MVDAKIVADCDTRLQRRAQTFAEVTGRTGCKVKTKGNEFILTCQEQCDKEVKKFKLPGDELKACKLAIAAVEGTTRKIQERGTEEKVKPDMPSMFELLYGWDPRDFSGPDCMPIIFPELQEFQKCLRKNQRSDCRAESERARQVLERTAIGERGRMLGAGDNRAVYALGPKCVIKIAMNRNKTKDNLREINAWNKIRNTGDKKIIGLFLPIVRADPTGAWLIMPRVKRVTTGDRNFDLEGANRKVLELGVNCGHIHADNWGYIGKKDRLVVIDYGHGCDVARVQERG